MEVLIRFRKSTWCINKLGIRRATHFDWKRAIETFEKLSENQVQKTINELENLPWWLKTNGWLDKDIEKGSINANHVWRDKNDNRLPK